MKAAPQAPQTNGKAGTTTNGPRFQVRRFNVKRPAMSAAAQQFAQPVSVGQQFAGGLLDQVR
jgi:hypothetical protein